MAEDIYTDEELLDASQIAYYNFNDKTKNMYSDGASLGEIWANDSTYANKLQNDLIYAKTPADIEAAQLNIDFYNKVTDPESEYYNWKIVDYRNENDKTGFCGCVIDTGDGNAIVAMRGSENYTTKITIDDWLNADFGLLNSTHTAQQKASEEYLKYIEENYGDKYEGFALTGHSLGGNLAFHSALQASEFMKNKIKQVVSCDGPGFSDEYIVANIDKIFEMAPKMKHLNWSVIS